jgi:hypothetical protein
VKTGDYLGLDNSTSALLFAPTSGASIYRWTTALVDGSNRPPDDTQGAKELMLQADVEPDVDCDKLGDETQDTNTADGPCAPGGAADVVPPKIRALSKTPRKPRVRRNVKFSYRISENARVTAGIERCARVRKNRCRRWRMVGMARQNAVATKMGIFRFKPTRPGRYRATFVATDAAGNVSLPRRLGFKVRPRR